MFFWNSLVFFNDPTDVGNLISGSSAFLKSSLYIRKFTVHVLLRPGLENFEHYFASVKWSHSVMSDSLRLHWLSPTRLLRRQSMEFFRQEYWSGLTFPSPGAFLTQGPNLGLPHCGKTLYHLSHREDECNCVVCEGCTLMAVWITFMGHFFWVFFGQAFWLAWFTVHICYISGSSHMCTRIS